VNRFRTIALTSLAGLVLVACGSSASGSPTPTAQPTLAPGQSQAAVQPSFSAGLVADLEALIPAKIGTITLHKTSMRGSDYLVSSGSDPATIKFLHDLGVSPSDISMAIGTGADQATGSFAFVFIVRAKGASSDKLVSAFETAMSQNASSPVQWTDSTVAGKHVRVAANSTGNTYVYAKGDTVFWIITTVQADAEAVLNGLP
jgi:hypothetical protein